MNDIIIFRLFGLNIVFCIWILVGGNLLRKDIVDIHMLQNVGYSYRAIRICRRCYGVAQISRFIWIISNVWISFINIMMIVLFL